MDSAQAAGVHGLKSAPSSDPECGPNPALFFTGEKCEKPHAQLFPQNQREMKKQLNPVLGGSLEDLSLQHDLEELENQRDLLHKTLLSPVLGRKL